MFSRNKRVCLRNKHKKNFEENIKFHNNIEFTIPQKEKSIYYISSMSLAIFASKNNYFK